MKKFIYAVVLIIVLILPMPYFIGKLSPEYQGIIDQLNPLVSETSSYVKTTTPTKSLEHGYFEYQQKAYNENGEEISLIFSADHELKLNRYLKISHKGQHVITYEEVSKEELPNIVLEKLT